MIDVSCGRGPSIKFATGFQEALLGEAPGGSHLLRRPRLALDAGMLIDDAGINAAGKRRHVADHAL